MQSVASASRAASGSSLGGLREYHNMAAPVPVGEARYALFDEPGTLLQPGKWDGPTHVMAIEHRGDGTTLFIRPFLDKDEETDEPGDRDEDLREVPTQKTRAGKHYTEPVVFDTCATALLPATLPVHEPENISQNVASFNFTTRRGDTLSLVVLRQHCPEQLRCAEVDIASPSPVRSATGTAGSADGSMNQIGKLVQAIEMLTVAQTKSIAGQQALDARLRALEHALPAAQQLTFAPTERASDRGTGTFTTATMNVQLPAADRALVDDLMSRRPTMPPPPAGSMPPMAPHPPTDTDAMGGESDAANAMLQRATVALEVLAGSGEQARVSMPKTKRSQLFKMEGHAVASLRTSSTRTSSTTQRR